MNKARKHRLKSVKNQLATALDDINAILDEEDEARENIPENLQTSEQYEVSEEASDVMGNVSDLIQEAINAIEYII